MKALISLFVLLALSSFIQICYSQQVIVIGATDSIDMANNAGKGYDACSAPYSDATANCDGSSNWVIRSPSISVGNNFQLCVTQVKTAPPVPNIAIPANTTALPGLASTGADFIPSKNSVWKFGPYDTTTNFQVRDWIMDNSVAVYFDVSKAPINVYITRSFTDNGNGGSNNAGIYARTQDGPTGGYPQKLRFYATQGAAHSMSFKNKMEFQFHLYAPYGQLELKNSGTWYGSIQIVKTFTAKNNFNMYLDYCGANGGSSTPSSCTCAGNPTACGLLTTPCGNITCTPSTCNDNNPCTTSDTCITGVCRGTPVVCTSSNPCFSPGTCNVTTGSCSAPVASSGAACDDGNACTSGDVCTNGQCAGSVTRTCSAQDQCFNAGVCNPATGTCSNPVKQGNPTCDDGNICTFNDVCSNTGVCNGTVQTSCDPNKLPYILMTTTTGVIFPTQSLWLALFFKGLTTPSLPKFKVTVPNFPNLPGYQRDFKWGFISYPSDRNYTACYRDEPLSNNEVDYVAVKFNPPQNQPAGTTISMQVRVDYNWDGIDRVGYHTVAIPVTQPLPSYTLVSDPEQLGVITPGQGVWVLVNFKTTARLLDFKVRFQSADVSFTYPYGRDYTSLYLDDVVQFNTTDYVAVRVVAPSGLTKTSIDAIMTVYWNDTTAQSFNHPVSFKVKQAKKSIFSNFMLKTAAPDFTLESSDIEPVVVGEDYFVLLSFMGGNTDLEEFSVSIADVDGIDFYYPSDLSSSMLGTLSANTDGFTFVRMYAPEEGSWDTTVSVSYNKDGDFIQTSVPITITAKSRGPIQLLIREFGLNLGEQTQQMVLYSEIALDNVEVSLEGLPGVQASTQNFAKMDENQYAIEVKFTVSDNVPGNNYAAKLQLNVIGGEKKATFSQASSVILSVNNPTSGGGKNDNKSDGTSAGTIAGATIGAVAGVALLAVGAAVIIKKRNSSVGPFNFQAMDKQNPSS